MEKDEKVDRFVVDWSLHVIPDKTAEERKDEILSGVPS